jgi:lambda repressor-like predicted transcriptional regulator
MTTSQTVADRIEAALKAEGRSVVWLSGNTGIAEKTLRRRLVAPDAFTIDELSSITRLLGISLEHLVREVANA